MGCFDGGTIPFPWASRGVGLHFVESFKLDVQRFGPAGTSACADQRYYCRNAGYMSLVLFSSRVNKYVVRKSSSYSSGMWCVFSPLHFQQMKHLCFSLDCCDGREAGKFAWDKLKKKIAIYQVVNLRKTVNWGSQVIIWESKRLSCQSQGAMRKHLRT